MAKFLVLYRASSDAQQQMANTTPEQAQAGMELWMQWAGKAGSSLVDLGAPLQSVATLRTKANEAPSRIEAGRQPTLWRPWECPPIATRTLSSRA